MSRRTEELPKGGAENNGEIELGEFPLERPDSPLGSPPPYSLATESSPKAEAYSAVPTSDPSSPVGDAPFGSQPHHRQYYNDLITGRPPPPQETVDYAPRRRESNSSSPLSGCVESLSCGGCAGDSMPSQGCLKVVGIAVVAVLVLVIVLVSLSFKSLHYYEYGFKRRSTTGSVDTAKVYGSGGIYSIGPDYEFKPFRSDAHFVTFYEIEIFASDRLQVQVSCTLQYFLRKNQLHLLHNNYDIHYEPVLHNNAKDAIKGAATQFSTRQYIHDREQIEETMFAAVQERLGGTCCEEDCGTGGERACVPGCKAYSTCTENDMGLFAEVRYFQLLRMNIPDELNERYLEALVLQEETETAKLLQDASLIRKETDKMVAQVTNEANEISHNATAQATLIAATAQASASATIERARSEGLKLLYDEIGLTDPDQKASFDYLRTLRGQSNANLNVNFQYMIAGGG